MTKDIIELLSGTIGDKEVREICQRIAGNDKDKREMYKLLFSSDPRVAAHAAWILTRLPIAETAFLQKHQNDIINNIIAAKENIPLQRLSLNILNNQKFEAETLRGDFIDYCIEGMMTIKNPNGLRAMCMKIAFKQCRLFPELLMEFEEHVRILKSQPQPPAISSTIKNIEKVMKTSRCSSKM